MNSRYSALAPMCARTIMSPGRPSGPRDRRAAARTRWPARRDRSPARSRARRRRARSWRSARRAGSRRPTVDLGDRLVDPLHQDRRDPHRRLIEHQQPRAGHQRAPDREHLLLAAGHRARLLAARAPSAGGTASNTRSRSSAISGAAAAVGAEIEVLAHGHPREAVAALGRERDPAADDVVRGDARDVLARRTRSSRRWPGSARRSSAASSTCRRRWSRSASRPRLPRRSARRP